VEKTSIANARPTAEVVELLTLRLMGEPLPYHAAPRDAVRAQA